MSRLDQSMIRCESHPILLQYPLVTVALACTAMLRIVLLFESVCRIFVAALSQASVRSACLVSVGNFELDAMAGFLLRAAPTALLARSDSPVERLFRQAVLVAVANPGKTRFRGKEGSLFVRGIELCRPFLIPSRSRRGEIEKIIFTFRNKIDVVTARVSMHSGSIDILWEHDSKDQEELTIEIGSAVEARSVTTVHDLIFNTLDSLFSVAILNLQQTIGDKQWKFQIKGTPASGGRPAVIPRKTLAFMIAGGEAGATEQPQPHVDWRRSIIEMPDGRTWQDVKISFGLNSGPTAREAHETRISECADALLNTMRAAPLRPLPKDSCMALQKDSIDHLSDREFGEAWRAACDEARRLNPNSRWGRQGRLKR